MEITQVFLEVPKWSQENFGDQKGLKHLAPLMGLLEELGELQEAIEDGENTDVINDAIGDIGVYSIDFMARLGFNPIDIWPDPAMKQDFEHTPIVYLRHIFHACLKRHQGIRGFDNNDQFYGHVRMYLSLFLARIDNNYNLTRHTIAAWKTVRERNWKTNPTGQGLVS
jgi:hypothetical protein